MTSVAVTPGGGLGRLYLATGSTSTTWTLRWWQRINGIGADFDTVIRLGSGAGTGTRRHFISQVYTDTGEFVFTAGGNGAQADEDLVVLADVTTRYGDWLFGFARCNGTNAIEVGYRWEGDASFTTGTLDPASLSVQAAQLSIFTGGAAATFGDDVESAVDSQIRCVHLDIGAFLDDSTLLTLSQSLSVDTGNEVALALDDHTTATSNPGTLGDMTSAGTLSTAGDEPTMPSTARPLAVPDLARVNTQRRTHVFFDLPLSALPIGRLLDVSSPASRRRATSSRPASAELPLTYLAPTQAAPGDSGPIGFARLPPVVTFDDEHAPLAALASATVRVPAVDAPRPPRPVRLVLPSAEPGLPARQVAVAPVEPERPLARVIPIRRLVETEPATRGLTTGAFPLLATIGTIPQRVAPQPFATLPLSALVVASGSFNVVLRDNGSGGFDIALADAGAPELLTLFDVAAPLGLVRRARAPHLDQPPPLSALVLPVTWSEVESFSFRQVGGAVIFDELTVLPALQAPAASPLPDAALPLRRATGAPRAARHEGVPLAALSAPAAAPLPFPLELLRAAARARPVAALDAVPLSALLGEPIPLAVEAGRVGARPRVLAPAEAYPLAAITTALVPDVADLVRALPRARVVPVAGEPVAQLVPVVLLPWFDDGSFTSTPSLVPPSRTWIGTYDDPVLAGAVFILPTGSFICVSVTNVGTTIRALSVTKVE